ncbi:hypothetical protein RclHR1_04530017 [Rhizophagus clarus]|uniref:Uncharacterized protein n=1 Tax=Rhizophagus clarus TaxID=94130 RepID=A0A2Z6RVF3_9GLOM|nr:hypothetical protein RclHR1_04530017 [Rhizophagus clarus]GET02810.1 hypothetical protein RCL_jg11774.t1 [Rhizophagus clarus]
MNLLNNDENSSHLTLLAHTSGPVSSAGESLTNPNTAVFNAHITWKGGDGKDNRVNLSEADQLRGQVFMSDSDITNAGIGVIEDLSNEYAEIAEQE